MAAVSLTTDDLAPFASIPDAKAEAMIADVLALAARVAPCILEADFVYEAAARAILRGAVLRWNDSGTGAVQSQTAGPFGQTIDTRSERKSVFWPSEITDLQALCRGAETTTATVFDIDTVPGARGGHADICTLNLGGLYCSCGAVLTNLVYPIYEA